MYTSHGSVSGIETDAARQTRLSRRHRRRPISFFLCFTHSVPKYGRLESARSQHIPIVFCTPRGALFGTRRTNRARRVSTSRAGRARRARHRQGASFRVIHRRPAPEPPSSDANDHGSAALHATPHTAPPPREPYVSAGPPSSRASPSPPTSASTSRTRALLAWVDQLSLKVMTRRGTERASSNACVAFETNAAVIRVGKVPRPPLLSSESPPPPQPRRSVRRGGRQQLVHRVHAHAAHPVLVPGEDARRRRRAPQVPGARHGPRWMRRPRRPLRWRRKRVPPPPMRGARALRFL